MTNDDTKFAIKLRDTALHQVADVIHQMMDGLRDAGLSTPQWTATAIADLRRQADLLDSRWTPNKHSRALILGYFTAADWLASHHGRPQPSKDAVALGRLALAFTRKRHTVCPFYGDGVMELVKGRSILRYFHKSTFEHIVNLKWTPKTDELVEAQWELSMHEGPLKPPPPVTTKTARARRGGHHG